MNKFTFEKTLILTPDGPTVEYYTMFGNGRRWTVTASKYGVSLDESPLMDQPAQLDAFARAVADAFRDYMSLNRTGKPYSPPQEEAKNEANA